MKGDKKRRPGRQVVSIIFIVNVDCDAVPKCGDDTKKAKFYDLKILLKHKKIICHLTIIVLLKIYLKKIY